MANIVGRDHELGEISSFLVRSRSATGALVLEGDPGIGKTTVWREKVALCHKGRTIKVPKSQVKKHRKHGDKFGACKKKKPKRKAKPKR